MPRIRTPFAWQASAFAAQATRDHISLQRDLNALRDSVAGLHRAIKAPVPKGGARSIRGSRSGNTALDRAGRAVFSHLLGSGVNSVLTGNLSGSFYTSASQLGSAYTSLSDLAQRVL